MSAASEARWYRETPKEGPCREQRDEDVKRGLAVKESNGEGGEEDHEAAERAGVKHHHPALAAGSPGGKGARVEREHRAKTLGGGEQADLGCARSQLMREKSQVGKDECLGRRGEEAVRPERPQCGGDVLGLDARAGVRVRVLPDRESSGRDPGHGSRKPFQGILPRLCPAKVGEYPSYRADSFRDRVAPRRSKGVSGLRAVLPRFRVHLIDLVSARDPPMVRT